MPALVAEDRGEDRPALDSAGVSNAAAPLYPAAAAGHDDDNEPAAVATRAGTLAAARLRTLAELVADLARRLRIPL
jgi:hypothetical protein